jgi:undecaprenyl-diphosphatase
MFIVTVAAVLMLCLGNRFLRGRLRAAGWVVAGLIAILTGLGRIDSGAHWPSDVLAGLLIAIAWIAFVLSIRPLSARVVEES